MAIVYPTRDEKGKEDLFFVGGRNRQSKGIALLCKHGSDSGWRHVRRAVRDSMEVIPAVFFMRAWKAVVNLWREESSVVSEIRAARHAGVGDDIANVGHSGDVADQAFESESKPGMRHGAVAA